LNNMGNPKLDAKISGVAIFRKSVMAFVFVCFAFKINALKAQAEIVVGNTNTIVATAFDQNTKDLYAIWKDSVRVFLAPEYLESNFFPLPKLEGFEIGVYRPFVANATLYFIHTMGGMVYRLDSDTLKRIDRSHNHRMQINSSMLVKNDTIFRYGGYGFWSHRNFFIFFSNSSLEWEIVLPHGKQDVPQGVSDAAITTDEENTFVFGGHYRLPYELYDGTFYDKIWQFNWPNHKWELLGSLHNDFSKADSEINMGDRVLYYMSRRLLAVVDPASNMVRNYMLPDSRFDFSCIDGICFPPNNLTWLIDGFYKDGNFYLPFFYPKNPADSQKSAGTLVYKIIPESEFLVTLVSEEPLYESAQSPISYAIGILLVIVAIGGSLLVFRKRKRQNKILVLEEGLMYRGQKIPLDPSSIALIKLLIASKGEASAQEVLELVENTSLSEGHNLKLRAQLVENINLRINTLMNSDKDIISMERSSTDRRNKSYRMDVGRFHVK
jgi:hypothetical protein